MVRIEPLGCRAHEHARQYRGDAEVLRGKSLAQSQRAVGDNRRGPRRQSFPPTSHCSGMALTLPDAIGDPRHSSSRILRDK